VILGRHTAQERLGPLMLRVVDDLAGWPCSTTTPPSMKTTRSATSRAKAISWVTTIIVMPVLGQLTHDREDLADKLGVEGGRRLVEEHELGLHAQRPRDRDALLLTTGQLARVGRGLSASPTCQQVVARGRPRPCSRP
jgi:hypothetical protein